MSTTLDKLIKIKWTLNILYIIYSRLQHIFRAMDVWKNYSFLHLFLKLCWFLINILWYKNLLILHKNGTIILKKIFNLPS